MANPHIKLPELTEQEIARFWSYVDKTPGQGPKGECWGWKRGRHQRGYGQFSYRGLDVRSNRVALFLKTGSDPGALGALHTCDWPPCCRDEHLFSGTHKDNMVDSAAKGRTACGDRHGFRLHPDRVARGNRHSSRTHPETRPRGERHGSHLHPERVARGNQSGARKHPEKLRPVRGDAHYSRTHPDKLARGDRSGSRKHPESRPRGENHPNAKLTEALVRKIRRAVTGKRGEVSRMVLTFNLPRGTLWDVIKGKTWKHVTDPPSE